MTGWRLYALAALAGVAALVLAATRIAWYGHSRYEAGRDALAAEYRAA